MYKEFRDQGFEILDFPCNQFGHQAPGSDDEIHAFCTAKYQTQFDQFAKIEVNGDNASEVYKILKSQQPTEEPKGLKNKMSLKAIAKISPTYQQKSDIVWNFTKFLVDKNGDAVRRYDPTFDPSEMEDEIVKLLNA